ncbi:MAG: glycosyltransferase family 39 protein [Acidimicrobiales bacterium]
MPGQFEDEADAVPTLTGPLRVAAAIGFCAVLGAAVVLRFVTHSALWLDEALTVDLARLPLSQIPEALKHDGAPPLYYYLLHFWIQLFGQSDLATRSLAGCFGVLSLVVAWFAGNRFGGRIVAWTTVILLASAPFAVFYATEARMYSLVILLTGCGFVALDRALDRPRPGNLVAVAAVTAALLYTQYWSLYLVTALGFWLVIDIVVRRLRPTDLAAWKHPVPALGAVVVGCLAFVPWLPTFVYQSKHTGTPWAAPVGFAALINVVTGFTANQGSTSTLGTVQGRLLALVYFGMAALALFGIGRTGRIVELDWGTRPRARGVTFVVVMTLFLAIAGGLLSSSAFSARYAAVVFLPLLMLVALGTTRLLNPVGRLVVVTVAVVAGMVGSVQNITTQRTQATAVASVINARAQPGDLIAFCPDQLGPAVYRLTDDPGRYDMVTFPRGTGPQIVDWVDYAAAVAAGSPGPFAGGLVRDAGTAHHIWMVWEPGYQTYGIKCEQIVTALQQNAGVIGRTWVVSAMTRYYEPMNLTEFTPAGA